MTGDWIRIVVVEDHHLVREGLVTLLNAVGGFRVVGQASDGDEAIALCRRLQPDVVLIDLRLPRRPGIEVIRTVRKELRRVRFIVLTTYDGEEEIYRALRAGANSYLMKGTTIDELAACIRLVHEGRCHVSPEIFEKLARRLQADDFTPREAEVLEHIARGRSNKQIARDLGVSVSTVKAHTNGLLNKLGVSDRTQAATAAIERGIVYADAPAPKLKTKNPVARSE